MVTAKRLKSHSETRFEQTLFIVGLIIYTGGQSLISLGRQFVDSLSPIDFAHWALLVGALLLVPYSMSLSRSILGKVSSYTLLVGVAGIICMCVIDFIIWSYPPGPERLAFTRHTSAQPSIWVPFVHVGPWMFGIGLVITSLAFLRTASLGVLIVVIGSVMSAATSLWYLVFAYGLITVGYILCFRATHDV